MANRFTYQVLKDTQQKVVIKLSGFFDGASGDESNASRITANTLAFALDSSKSNLLSSTANTGPLPYYGLSVQRIWYNSTIPAPGHVRLSWTADTPQTILGFGFGSGTYNDQGNWINIPNLAAGSANCNGNIGITTFGANTANTTYNIIVELRKDNSTYDRGQMEDPAAFNYGNYKIRP